MEKFEYQVLAEEDFRREDEVGNTSSSPKSMAVRLQNALESYGEKGFRFISSLHNSSGSWIIILSRPVNTFPDAPQKGYSNRRPSYERGRSEDRSQGQFPRRQRF